MFVTIGDLIESGRRLELGCYACDLHIYVDPREIPVAPATTIPTLSEMLTCPQCKAENAEPGYPVWTRPDARPPLMGASVAIDR